MKYIALVISLSLVTSLVAKANTCAQFFETPKQITNREELSKDQFQTIVELAKAEIEAEAMPNPLQRSARLASLIKNRDEIKEHGVSTRLYFEIKDEVANSIQKKERVQSIGLKKQTDALQLLREEYLIEGEMFRKYGVTNLHDLMVKILIARENDDLKFILYTKVFFKKIKFESPINNNADTFLHFAVQSENFEAAELLISKGAKVDSKNKKQETPFHNATLRAHVKMMQLLIDNKADINAANKDLRAPLHMALGWDLRPLELLTNNGAKIDAADKDSKTALHHAAFSNNLKAMEMLLDKWANVSALDSESKTPLHYSASFGHIDGMELLFDRGAKVDAVDKKLRTALHYASKYGDEEAINLLFKKGAAVDAKDINLETPLHFAASHGRVDAVKLLIDKGADVSALNIDGKTPLDLAIAFSDPKALIVIKKLLSGAKP